MKNGLKIYRDKELFGNLVDKMYDLDNFIMNDFPTIFEYPKNTVGQVNIRENEKEYILDVMAPGFSKEELNVDIKDEVLNISGNHSVENKEEKKNYFRREFTKNSFKKSFSIPKNVEGEVDAKLENGILTVSLRKKELPPKEEPKRIEIK